MTVDNLTTEEISSTIKKIKTDLESNSNLFIKGLISNL